jgi:DNA-binding beta-propeller fold protein YncE
MPSGLSSLAMAITPDGRKAYVTNQNNSVSVFDLVTNTAGPILTSPNLGTSREVAITPDGHTAFVAAGPGCRDHAQRPVRLPGTSRRR